MLCHYITSHFENHHKSDLYFFKKKLISCDNIPDCCAITGYTKRNRNSSVVITVVDNNHVGEPILS